LNIWGFVAQALEPEPEKVTIVERIEDLFEEFREPNPKVVGLERGNWRFKIWNSTTDREFGVSRR